MKIWVDVDNPPQVQYLMPVAEALRSRGDDILITARAYGSTVELLRQRGVRARVVGREFGAQRHAKAIGVLRRAGALLRIVLTQGRSDVLLSSSRSSAVAARLAGIPCLIVSDYEHSELGLYRKTGAHLLHPDVIPQEAFAGWSPSRLHSFRGIKEDLTIGAADLDSVEPFAIAPEHNGRQRVLFRPPAEESHYFQPRSRQLALQVLSQLAADEARVVVFTPRHAHQVHDLDDAVLGCPAGGARTSRALHVAARRRGRRGLRRRHDAARGRLPRDSGDQHFPERGRCCRPRSGGGRTARARDRCAGVCGCNRAATATVAGTANTWGARRCTRMDRSRRCWGAMSVAADRARK